MADPTKIIRFPNKSKLHLVWNSSLPEDASESLQHPANTNAPPADAKSTAPEKGGGEATTPDKSD